MDPGAGREDGEEGCEEPEDEEGGGGVRHVVVLEPVQQQRSRLLGVGDVDGREEDGGLVDGL